MRSVKSQPCSWLLYSCEFQHRCYAYLSHAFKLLLPLLDALFGPLQLLFLQAKLLPGLIQLLLVPLQLFLLGSQLLAL